MNNGKRFANNEPKKLNSFDNSDDFYDNYVIADAEKSVSPKKKRLDENGNPIPPKKRRLDENGNPIPPKKRRLDENGNPIPPKKRRLDENGNPIPPKKRRLDENGNPIPPKKRRLDENGNPIPPKKKTSIDETSAVSAKTKDRTSKKTKRGVSKQKKKSNLVSNILLGVFGAIFLTSLYMIISYYYTSFQEQSSFNELSDIVKNASENIDYDKLDISGVHKDEAEVDPQIAIDASILAAYQKLYEQNNDMVGWIQVENSNINYPVMLTQEDPEYYIHRSFDDEYSYAGTPFIGEGGKVSPNSDNLVIYAHHMKDGSMFADLMKYAREDGFWQAHTKIMFDTLDERAVYEIYGIYSFDVSVGNGHYDFYNRLNFNSEEEFNSFLANMDRYSVTNDIVSSAEFGDQFISLVTCSYYSDNGRLVVMAKKVKE